MREVFDSYQRFLREAEQQGLLHPDVHQHLAVQRLVEAAKAGDWSEQELWDALCATLATNKDQLHNLQQLAAAWSKKEASSKPHIAPAAPGASASSSQKKPSELGSAGPRVWIGLTRRRWLVLALVLTGIALPSGKWLYKRWHSGPDQQAAPPPPPALEKTRPDSHYVKRPLPIPKENAAPTTQPVPLKLWRPDLRSEVWLGLGCFGLALLGWLLLRVWPHLRKRLEELEAERKAEEAKRQAAKAEQARREAEVLAQANAEYARLEEEAFAAGQSIRPDYRIELAPPLPATLLDDTATLLGRIYQASHGNKLDVMATLHRTIKAGGRPQPVMALRRRAVELLVLYDEWDTQPYLPGFHKLLDRWQKLGVHLQRWSFKKEPVELESPSKQRKLALEDLLNLHDDAPVILFASRLHIRGQDDYKSWPKLLRGIDLKVWLDPDPRPTAEREDIEEEAIKLLTEQLGAPLPRFGMTVMGVQAMVRYLQQQGQGVLTPDWEPLVRSPQSAAAIERWLACGVQVPDCSYDQFEAVRQVFLAEELPDPRSIRWMIDRFDRELGSTYRQHENTVVLSKDRKRELKRWLRKEHPELQKKWNLLLYEQLVDDESEEADHPLDLPKLERRKRQISYRAGAADDTEAALRIVSELDGTPLHAQAQAMKEEILAVAGVAVTGETPTPPPEFGWKQAKGTRLLVGGVVRAWAVATGAVVLVAVLVSSPRLEEWIGNKLPQPVKVTIERITDYEVVKTESFAVTRYRPALLPIPKGSFVIGSSKGEPERYEAEEPHEVELTQPFLMMETEVTQGQYEALMGENPSKDREDHHPSNPSLSGDPCSVAGVGENLPVYCVDWFDAVAYANRLSEKEGLEKCYQTADKKVEWPKKQGCKGYRLPTEAEWEYAARAGKSLVYAGSDKLEEVAWFASNSGRRVHEVKQAQSEPGYKKPNDWGLHAMNGNVVEWVWDAYAPYQAEDRKNPTGPHGSRRVFRGGSWDDVAEMVRVAYRYGGAPGFRSRRVGFRLARSYP